MLDDDVGKNGQIGGFTRATSMESNIDIAHLQSSDQREQHKKYDYLSLNTTKHTTSPTTLFLNRAISSSVTLYCDRVEQDIREDEHGAVATIHPPHDVTATPPLLKQPQDQKGPISDEEEWGDRKDRWQATNEQGLRIQNPLEMNAS